MAEDRSGGGNIVVYGALAANVGIAVAKFVAAGISGSSSMLSEGFHSVVDSTNELLLLWGEYRAKRPPDQAHPFGYGRELYFWSFVVAVLIFALGAGLSAYEGYLHIVDPEVLSDPLINYVVLGVSALFEGTSLTIAVRQLARTKGEQSWWGAVRNSKDPSTLAVVFEDSAALGGLLIAAIGVFVSHAMGEPRIDGVASIGIGVLLALVAALLAREAKGLLIGEAADPGVVARVRDLVAADKCITAVNHVRTVHSSPEAIFVAISADFEDDVKMGDAENMIEEIEARLKKVDPRLRSIYIRPERADQADWRANDV